MNSNLILLTDRVIKFERKLLFFSNPLQLFLECNMESGVCSIAGKPNTKDYCRSFYKNDEYFFLFPEGKGDMYKYRMGEEGSERIKIPSELHNDDERNWSSNYIYFNDSLYFYWQNPVITKYNVLSGKWDVYREWRNELAGSTANDLYLSREALICENDILFPIGNTRRFVKLDTIGGLTSVIEIGFKSEVDKVKGYFSNENGIWALCECGNSNISLFFSPNIKSFEFECVGTIQFKNCKTDYLCAFAVLNDKAFILPGDFDKAYVINTKTSMVTDFDSMPLLHLPDLESKRHPYNYLQGQSVVVNDEIWSINAATGDIVCIDTRDSSSKVMKISMDDSVAKESLNNYVNNHGIVKEDFFDLNDYLKSI